MYYEVRGSGKPVVLLHGAFMTITTVTFEEIAGKTLLVVRDLSPSKEALDSGSTGALPEALDQLDELLASLGAGAETK